jgi:hypothetical protein
LRVAIALWNRASFEVFLIPRAIAPQIVKIRTEVREVIVAGGYFLKLPVNLFKLLNSIESDFGNRCLPFETGIPGTPSAAVEPVPAGYCMSEGRIHDLGVSHSVKEFMNADVR